MSLFNRHDFQYSGTSCMACTRFGKGHNGQCRNRDYKTVDEVLALINSGAPFTRKYYASEPVDAYVSRILREVAGRVGYTKDDLEKYEL